MKTFKTSFLAVILSLTLFSCSKIADKVSGGAFTSGKCEIKADISGAVSGKYESVLISSMLSKSAAIINLNTTTTTMPVKNFMISLPGNVKVGTYKIVDNMDGVWAFSYVHDMSSATQAEATLFVTPLENKSPNFTVTVTKINDTEIEGTFSGTMMNGKTAGKNITVSNGSFKGKF